MLWLAFNLLNSVSLFSSPPTLLSLSPIHPCLSSSLPPFESGAPATTHCPHPLPSLPPLHYLGTHRLLFVHLPLTRLFSHPPLQHPQNVALKMTKYPMRLACLSEGTPAFHSCFHSCPNYSFFSLPTNVDHAELSTRLKNHLSVHVHVNLVRIIRDSRGGVCAFVQCNVEDL